MTQILTSDTQWRIIDTFFLIAQEHPEPEKITLIMVAKRVGLRRESIYKYHFKNMDEIIERIHILVDDDIEEKMKNFIETNKNNPVTFFVNEILPLLYHKRDWLKVLYSTKADPSWAGFIHQKYTEIIKTFLSLSENKHELSVEFLSSLIVRQIIAILANWLTSDQPEPVSLFSVKFIKLLKTSTYDLIECQALVEK